MTMMMYRLLILAIVLHLGLTRPSDPMGREKSPDINMARR